MFVPTDLDWMREVPVGDAPVQDKKCIFHYNAYFITESQYLAAVFFLNHLLFIALLLITVFTLL